MTDTLWSLTVSPDRATLIVPAQALWVLGVPAVLGALVMAHTVRDGLLWLWERTPVRTWGGGR